MRHSTRRLALAASAVLAITAAAGAAMAQMPPPPPAPPAPPAPPPPPLPPMDAMMMGGDGMVMMHHRMHGDPEAHAKHLRDVLQLRPDQDGALKAYLDATAPQKMAEGLKWDSKDDDDKPLTTPERLDRQAAHMAKMAETFQKRASATKAFYAALSPSQQKAFDAIGPHGGGPKMGHGEGHKEERKMIMKHKAG
jgi:protein CpxP